MALTGVFRTGWSCSLVPETQEILTVQKNEFLPHIQWRKVTNGYLRKG